MLFRIIMRLKTQIAKATDEYDRARKKVASFINAGDAKEIVFTKNATEAINLVAYSWGLANLKSEDEMILTVVEHHSAIVPWQLVTERTDAVLKFALDANFLVASSYKVRHRILVRKDFSTVYNAFILSGGEMISNVFLDNSTFAQPPSSWALAIGEAIGLRDAVDYLSGNGMQKNHSYEPLHRALNVSSSAQTSLYFYKTKEDVDYFIQALNDTVSFFDTFK
ncbi:cysteine desulfurase 1 [Cucumis melo var. makuwa]|uniref:Cysteine desulfurase 1 n=1 Tax=Cucumis melo var. makuwa TaxID=1194695 RepID=A0A5A7V6L6_CUCMM|nr:cysteine desulfurase 1 [Cucumis melo var. makuwa]TYK22517.1 cysteine desulfurase 1 [Cucumis melo var. makuwa]